jgi:hypothetical protein
MLLASIKFGLCTSHLSIALIPKLKLGGGMILHQNGYVLISTRLSTALDVAFIPIKPPRIRDQDE